MKILEFIHDEDHPETSNMDAWVESRFFHLTQKIRVYRNGLSFVGEDYDMITLHGGGQHLWDENREAWLSEEIDFVRDAIFNKRKAVIGFCLGSQIIAEALGAKVYKMEKGEIGWFGINVKYDHPLVRDLGDRFESFLWHTDHYDLPGGCVSLASTGLAEHQIYASEEYPVCAYQFHPEYTKTIIQHYFETGFDEYWANEAFNSSKDDFSADLAIRPQTYGLFSRLMDNAMEYLAAKYKISNESEVQL